MDNTTVQGMLDEALAFAAKDLREVIATQEATLRAGGGPCPKLGEYRDDLALVTAEQRRRERLRVKTTAGETFECAETTALARLIFKRFGRDPEVAASAWRRLLSNGCGTADFMALVEAR